MSAKPMRLEKGRDANYALLKIAELFVPAKGDDVFIGTCGNIQNLVDDTAIAGRKWEDSFRANVAAPYLLARLCALFEDLNITSCGQASYKITWQTALIHPETGFRLTFYDYKGCASFGSDVVSSKTAAEKLFLKDVKKLLKVLRDNRCPHPYDGCVVGEIA